jgi:uncharacterized protein YndB with AHSA1/START domain
MKSNITGQASISIEAPVEKVWQALTTPSIIKQYFFGTDTISDFKAGSPIKFKGEYQGKQYEDKGTIIEVIPNKLFSYNYWSSMSGIEDKPEKYMIVTYALSKEEGHTSLTIMQENIADEKTREHSEQNWNMVLGDLKKLLETKH